MELSIENTIIFISKMCGCVDTLQHITTYYMYIQDMLRTVYSISSHHIMYGPVNNAS